MKTPFLCCGIFAVFTLASCGGKSQPAEVQIIDVVGGVDRPTELKVSDLGKTIRYIPLETTDSCLVGNNPEVKVLNDKLLVYTSRQCLLFDRETGKFLCTIGHMGNDPEAYSVSIPYLNPQNQMLYFGRKPNQLVKYDLRGKYIGTITIPSSTSPGEKGLTMNMPDMNGYLFSDSIITAHCVGGLGQKCYSSLLSFSESGTLIDTVPALLPELGTGRVEDIASISVRKGFGLMGGIIYVQYNDGSQSFCAPGDAGIWQNGGELRLKELFTDTIYTVKGNGLEKYRVFDTGKYHWPASERTQQENNADRLLVSYAMENERILYFQLIRGIYTDKHTLYNGVYNKQSKTTTIALADNAFVDDLTHFMPFVPTFINNKGEYAALVQAFDASTWLEEHPESATAPELSVLKGLSEESNPIVVLVE